MPQARATLKEIYDMAGRITFSILDHSGEVGSVGMWTPTLTNANVDTYTNDNALGALGDMRIALNGLILGNHLNRTVTAVRIADPAGVPADVNAQRERKAMVTYRDDVTGKLYRIEIPTFNMVGSQSGTDELDTSGSEWQAFITEFEANYVSEVGNAVTVLGARHVGRAS